LSSLVALWNVSLLLCAVTLLALAGILLARLVAESRAARRAGERRRIAAYLLDDGQAFPAMPRGALERDAAAKVTLELAELVRGPERDALMMRAQALGVHKVLLRQSVSRSAQNRLQAAEALAMFPKGRERVREMLRDANPDVRLGAALALAQNHAAPPARELVRQLSLGTRERSLLTASLMRDLVDYDPASVEELLADPEAPASTKLAALDALAASGRVEHAPLVAKMAEDIADDSDLLPRIHHALGRIGHPSGHSAILEGLANPAWEVRAAAAQAAGKNGLIPAPDALGVLLGDVHWWVRFRAAEALWRLGVRGHEVLERVAREGNTHAREAAAVTLKERAA
jgi:HEAT repeat protein